MGDLRHINIVLAKLPKVSFRKVKQVLPFWGLVPMGVGRI
jgi:hypothetical protein